MGAWAAIRTNTVEIERNLAILEENLILLLGTSASFPPMDKQQI